MQTPEAGGERGIVPRQLEEEPEVEPADEGKKEGGGETEETKERFQIRWGEPQGNH
jgi:hypothetical protein